MHRSSYITARGRAHLWLAWSLAALAALAGCGLFRGLPSTVLLASEERPALFLSSGANAEKIGYVSLDVPLTVTGRARSGRVPVRIEGALRTRGFVDAQSLVLRVQRRGRIRGTPVYVGPDDLVHVVGRAGLRKRLRVRVRAQLDGRALGAVYEGSYPREGLAAQRAPKDAQAPDPGAAYEVPANTPVPLFEAPGAARVAELPPQELPYRVRVVNAHEGWFAVRAGHGPYLIGWTQAPLVAAAPSAEAPPATAARGAIPTRLVEEEGELKRVAAGTKVVFGDQVIGVFKQPGYARVVRVYADTGYADVFAAADDGVALRGLVRTADLVDAPEGTRATPAAAVPSEPPASTPPALAQPASTPPAAEPPASTPTPGESPPTPASEDAGAPAGQAL